MMCRQINNYRAQNGIAPLKLSVHPQQRGGVDGHRHGPQELLRATPTASAAPITAHWRPSATPARRVAENIAAGAIGRGQRRSTSGRTRPRTARTCSARATRSSASAARYNAELDATAGYWIDGLRRQHRRPHDHLLSAHAATQSRRCSHSPPGGRGRGRQQRRAIGRAIELAAELARPARAPPATPSDCAAHGVAAHVDDAPRSRSRAPSARIAAGARRVAAKRGPGRRDARVAQVHARRRAPSGGRAADARLRPSAAAPSASREPGRQRRCRRPACPAACSDSSIGRRVAIERQREADLALRPPDRAGHDRAAAAPSRRSRARARS